MFQLKTNCYLYFIGFFLCEGCWLKQKQIRPTFMISSVWAKNILI